MGHVLAHSMKSKLKRSQPHGKLLNKYLSLRPCTSQMQAQFDEVVSSP